MKGATQTLTHRGIATRARIVDAAVFLVTTQGLANTGLDAVLVRSRASKSQLYQHFKGRDELILAVVERKVEMVLASNETPLRELSSFAQLRRWRTALIAQSRQSDLAGGCPLGSLVGELGEWPRARAAISDGFSRWQALFVAGYGRMRTSGELMAEAKPRELATATLAALQGGLLMSQVERTVRPLEAALDMALANVRRFLA